MKKVSPATKKKTLRHFFFQNYNTRTIAFLSLTFFVMCITILILLQGTQRREGYAAQTTNSMIPTTTPKFGCVGLGTCGPSNPPTIPPANSFSTTTTTTGSTDILTTIINFLKGMIGIPTTTTTPMPTPTPTIATTAMPAPTTSGGFLTTITTDIKGVLTTLTANLNGGLSTITSGFTTITGDLGQLAMTIINFLKGLLGIPTTTPTPTMMPTPTPTMAVATMPTPSVTPMPKTTPTATIAPANTGTITMTKTITQQGVTNVETMQMPVAGGNITGTITQDCKGTITGTYTGAPKYMMTGSSLINCLIGGVINFQGTNAFTGVIDPNAMTATVNYTVTGTGVNQTGTEVFNYTIK